MRSSNLKNINKELDLNGYCFLRKVIPVELIKSIQSYAAELLGCNNSVDIIINEMGRLEKNDKNKFYNFCKQIGQILPTINIALQSEILNTIKTCFKQKNVYLADSAVFFNKIDVTRLQYDWHTERSYYPNADEVITLWFPWLHEVNVQNGTMILAKGSNKKKFRAERIEVKNGFTQMKINEKDLCKFELVPCNLSLGDCVLFTLDLAHRTGPNTSGVPRTTLIVRFSDFKGKFQSGWTVSKN
jgi:ectoine hydroxylase-related dioxygenase (phytanoyl-CoA dioxygenase family)